MIEDGVTRSPEELLAAMMCRGGLVFGGPCQSPSLPGCAHCPKHAGPEEEARAGQILAELPPPRRVWPGDDAGHVWTTDEGEIPIPAGWGLFPAGDARATSIFRKVVPHHWVLAKSPRGAENGAAIGTYGPVEFVAAVTIWHERRDARRAGEAAAMAAVSARTRPDATRRPAASGRRQTILQSVLSSPEAMDALTMGLKVWPSWTSRQAVWTHFRDGSAGEIPIPREWVLLGQDDPRVPALRRGRHWVAMRRESAQRTSVETGIWVPVSAVLSQLGLAPAAPPPVERPRDDGWPSDAVRDAAHAEVAAMVAQMQPGPQRAEAEGIPGILKKGWPMPPDALGYLRAEVTRLAAEAERTAERSIS
ncbi:MAG: hypothetical protein ACRD0J_13540 [Acidimicrobiales bacterium]